jgi:peptide deformylase
MQRLPIIIAPDPRLKQVAAPVTAVDADIRGLMDAMLETMHLANGLGLAAPQVGVLKRVIVVDVAERDQPPQPYRLANPEIVWRSSDVIEYDEGCLSLPQHYGQVARPEKVRVRYLDHQNELRELEASGVLARCLQHEIDHLEGTLFVDHLSSLKRGMILRKLSKQKRQLAEAAA